MIDIPCHPDFLYNEITIDTKDNVIENVPENKSDVRERIFKLIVQDNHITRKQIAATIGINPSAVQKHLLSLIANGYVERRGKTRGSYFVVLKEVVK